jgi:hypothetical protein
MGNKSFVWMLVASALLGGTALGGLDRSGGAGAENLSMADFGALGAGINTDTAVLEAGAPQAASGGAGTELAVYTDQAPSEADQAKLQPSSVIVNPPMYIYYQGQDLAWKDFNAIFPIGRPGLWIERAAGWSSYATMPLGSWTRELLYVPAPSSLTLYELYPGGFVMAYKLGFVKPGYYVIWYYADSPGRHLTAFASSSGYSNAVIIDVYEPSPWPPAPPSPKEQCEQKPYCHWVNGQCLCTMPNPEKEQCLEKPYCSWVNEQCLCVMPINPEKESCLEKPYCSWVNDQCLCTMPNPEKEQCEENPNCDWVNDHCYCRGIPPVDHEKESCEQNPECSYVNGQCLCRGLNPPEPMPGPDPEEATCLQNPSCHYAGGTCYCMGVGGMEGGGGDSGDSRDLLGNV